MLHSHVSNETTTDDQDRLLSDQTLGVHEVDDLVEGVHVLVDLSALDDLPGDGNGVVRKVLVDCLLVDTSDVWRRRDISRWPGNERESTTYSGR